MWWSKKLFFAFPLPFKLISCPVFGKSSINCNQIYPINENILIKSWKFRNNVIVYINIIMKLKTLSYLNGCFLKVVVLLSNHENHL